MSVLEAKDISVRFGDAVILDRVSMRVEPGRLVGLIGPNGAGKTTLLRALASLQDCTGSVTVDGVAASRMPRRDFARTIAYMAQVHDVHWPLSVRRLVALGRLPHLSPWDSASAADWESVARAMDEADVTAFAERSVTTLSGGERARAMLARALAVEAPILLVDEPVASLDPYHQLHVMELLRDYADRGGAVVAVLHDLTLAARFCHGVVLLHRGGVVAHGDAAQVMTPENIERAYRVSAFKGSHEGESFFVAWRRR